MAAMATDRSEMARRSSNTATSMTETMMKARLLDTAPPESARYPAPTNSAPTAANFLVG